MNSSKDFLNKANEYEPELTNEEYITKYTNYYDKYDKLPTNDVIGLGIIINVIRSVTEKYDLINDEQTKNSYIQQGWDIARRITCTSDLTMEDIGEIFGEVYTSKYSSPTQILADYKDVTTVMEKLEEFDNETKFKFGDEVAVAVEGSKCIKKLGYVIGRKLCSYTIMFTDLSVKQYINRKSIKKTGNNKAEELKKIFTDYSSNWKDF